MTKFNLSHYLVIGPENCAFKPYGEVVAAAVRAGFTCIQLRLKTASDAEFLTLAAETARIIEKLGRQDEVSFLINDRPDIALKARAAGIKTDGVHVGQCDTPPAVCKKMIGEDAIAGLSAPQEKLLEYLESADLSCVDYFGLAPLRETETKNDLAKNRNNRTIIPAIEEINAFAEKSPLPVVMGGGVKKDDLTLLAKTALSGYFVVSAVCGAEDPYKAASELVNTWNSCRNI
ncbi:MAG: thiamine phosphate synthase [Synergistaceae bacterium]|nr:thiamine phosphate synthase [Synergistaceae bacterium]